MVLRNKKLINFWEGFNKKPMINEMAISYQAILFYSRLNIHK